jgi:hypothetical protein
MTVAAYQQSLVERAQSELGYSQFHYDRLCLSDPKHPSLALMADSIKNMKIALSVKSTATHFLNQIASEPCTTVTLLAQGILWAESSCRIDGTMAIALRNSTAAAAANLLDQMIAGECETMSDAARWLNDNRVKVLEILG